jgi:hypothetical protein
MRSNRGNLATLAQAVVTLDPPSPAQSDTGLDESEAALSADLTEPSQLHLYLDSQF